MLQPQHPGTDRWKPSWLLLISLPGLLHMALSVGDPAFREAFVSGGSAPGLEGQTDPHGAGKTDRCRPQTCEALGVRRAALGVQGTVLRDGSTCSEFPRLNDGGDAASMYTASLSAEGRRRIAMAVWPPDLDQYISRSLIKHHRYGDSAFFEHVFSTAPSALGRRPLFVDVGANIGVHSLQALYFGLDVVAFEPNPWNARRLNMSIEANCFDRHRSVVRLHQAAVSDEAGGTLHMRVPKGSPGMGSLGNITGLPDLRGMEVGGADFEMDVPITTIDKEITLRRQQVIALLKMDVEGFELKALQGARRLFAHRKILALHIEFFPALLDAAGTDPIDVLKFIDAQGMEIRTSRNVVIAPKSFERFVETTRKTGRGGHANLVCLLAETAADTPASKRTVQGV